MNRQKNDSVSGLPIGMCLGLAIGTAIGSATKNMGLWMPLGVSFGAMVGLLFKRSEQPGTDDAAEEENKQDQEDN